MIPGFATGSINIRKLPELQYTPHRLQNAGFA